MRKYYPNYSIGTDAYADIPMVCEKYGTKGDKAWKKKKK